GGLDRRAERRIDEPVGPPRRVERESEHPDEHRRGGDEFGGGGVDSVELAVGTKAAERPLELLEEEPDRLQLRFGRAADEDVDSHRLKTVRRHWSEPEAGWSKERSRSRWSSSCRTPSSSPSRTSRRPGSCAPCGRGSWRA